jgi:hypothetical protein
MAASSTNFGASVTQAGNLLRSMGLLLVDNPKPFAVDNIAARSRKMRYSEHWRLLVEGSAYKFLLSDYSFFTFRTGEDGVSYGYYPNPVSFISYEDFLFTYFGDDWRDERDDPNNAAAYLSEMENGEPRDASLTLRFDYHPEQYSHGRHPAAHMHAGFDTEVRIGCGLILTPLAFVCFAMRQVYPGPWSDSYAELEPLASSSGPKALECVGGKYLGLRDKLELYLS